MPDTTTPGQRFTQLIQQLGLTKNAFAQSLGKTATVIQHIVDERNKPGYDLLNKVCEVYPNVASDWLVLGRGPMLRDNNPQPLFTVSAAEAASASPPPVPNGINPDDIPPAAPRRNGSLLRPADIAATLALAPNGPAKGSPAPTLAPTAPAAASPLAPAVAAAAPAPALEPAPSEVAASVCAAVAAPDPAYLAAALHTVQLQHQLALAEQRSQHLLEQQALLKQLVEVLQR